MSIFYRLIYSIDNNYNHKKGGERMPKPKKDVAADRGNRAKQLFDKPGVIDDIISILEKEDLHRADPIANPDSFKQKFFDKCWDKIDDPIITNPEKAVFINDLWNATWASRKSQEQKPCW